MSYVRLLDVSVRFPLYRTNTKATLLKKMIGFGGEQYGFNALNNISVEFAEGDKVVLLGENGSGKSTLLKVLAGILPPTEGKRQFKGEVFPAINPVSGVLKKATCAQNIVLQGLYYGMKGEALRSFYENVSEFSGLGDFLNSPFDILSTGMRGRFAVSMLVHLKPQLLFMDEWVGASDSKVLEKNTGLLTSLVNTSHVFVLASHRKELVRNHCNRALVIKGGEIMFDGDVESALKE